MTNGLTNDEANSIGNFIEGINQIIKPMEPLTNKPTDQELIEIGEFNELVNQYKKAYKMNEKMKTDLMNAILKTEKEWTHKYKSYTTAALLMHVFDVFEWNTRPESAKTGVGVEDLKLYGKHLGDCNTRRNNMQLWNLAHFNNKEFANMSVVEKNRYVNKLNVCTCGFDELIKSATALQKLLEK